MKKKSKRSAFIIPRAALSQHILLLGKTRSGKSSKMRLIVEHFLNRKKPVCILDPKGDWWGLKLSASGKRAGYPIVVFGTVDAHYADVRINEHSGAVIAELAATSNLSCIVDLKGMMPGARTRFFVDFASTFFRCTRGQRVLAIDEVHNFAPQGKVLDPEAGKMLHWANRLITEGGGMGITMLSASQRPQKVHKDYVTSHETLIACRVLHKLDRDAIKDWIDACGDPEMGKQVLATLAGMKRSEGWVYSPEAEVGPARMMFPLFSTYDSFAPQKAKKRKRLKGWATINLKSIEAKIGKLAEEAKANPAELKREIARLKRQLSERPATPAASAKPVVDKAALIEAEARGYQRGQDDISIAYVARIATAQALLTRDISNKLNINVERKKFKASVPPISHQVGKAESPKRAGRALPVRSPLPAVGGNGALPEGERKILTAVVQFNGCDRDQLSTLVALKKSSRDVYIRSLKTKGLVETDGKRVSPTIEARPALGDDFEPLPTGAELRGYWRTRLPDGERKILDEAIKVYPDWIERDTISESVELKKSSRDVYIRALKARQLLDVEKSRVRASAELF